MVKININLGRIRDAVPMAIRKTSEVLEKDFNSAITQNIWAWPRGETPRDIVDTGELLRSQHWNIDDKTMSYTCTAPYAKIVHDGAVLANGTVIPARPWTTKVLKKKKPSKIMRAFFNDHIR